MKNVLTGRAEAGAVENIGKRGEESCVRLYPAVAVRLVGATRNERSTHKADLTSEMTSWRDALLSQVYHVVMPYIFNLGYLPSVVFTLLPKHMCVPSLHRSSDPYYIRFGLPFPTSSWLLLLILALLFTLVALLGIAIHALYLFLNLAVLSLVLFRLLVFRLLLVLDLIFDQIMKRRDGAD